MSKVDPETLYRQYQADRSKASFNQSLAHNVQINELMERIAMRDSRESLLNQLEQDQKLAESSIERTSISLGSFLSTVFRSPSKVIEWMRSGLAINLGGLGAVSLRRAVPIMAVMVFAIALTPILYNSESSELNTLASASHVPVSMLKEADAMVAYMESNTLASMGFSNTETNQGRMFDLGMLVTDVSIVAAGVNLDRRKEILELLEHYSAVETGLVKESLDDLISELSEAEFKAKELAEHLDGLSHEIQSIYAEDDGASMFQLGQRIENVSLAANYAIDSQHVETLSDALNNIRSLDSIGAGYGQSEILNELLQELSQFGSSHEPSIADARKINALLTRIRLVVQ